MQVKHKRPAVVWTVMRVLEKYHKKGKIHEATFDIVQPEVLKRFPTSKFNPFHLAWYKHHFLKGDLEFMYSKEAQLEGVER